MRFKTISLDTNMDVWWTHVYEKGFWFEYWKESKNEIWKISNPPTHLLDTNRFKISKSFRRLLEEEEMIWRMK